MNKQKNISVITTSFNQGKYLVETTQQVVNQNYSNIEYIVIDGGSTDNSIKIIKKNINLKSLIEVDNFLRLNILI